MSNPRQTEILENRFGKPLIQRATGAAAVAMAINPGFDFQLREIRIHLNAAGGAGTLTITVDNGVGAAYDTVLVSQDMTAVTDYYYQPSIPLSFTEDDHLDIVWANAGTKTYGIEVIYARY